MLSLPDYPVRQRDFLLEISRAITSRLDISEVLKRVLHASVVMTAGRVGLIALRNDDDQQFHVRAFTGIQRDSVEMINNRLHEIMENAAQAGFFEYLQKKLAEMASDIDPTLAQSVAMPLVFDKSPLGLLIVYRSYQAEVTENDLQILHSFADQAAIAVHNAQLYERIKQEQQRLSAILNYSGDGVMILDADLTVLQVNRAFERMTGWASDDAVGLPQDEVIDWAQLDNTPLSEMIDNGWLANGIAKSEVSPTHYVEGDITRRDGMTLSIGITYAPLFNDEGKIGSIIANVRDITNIRKAQEMQNIFISTVSHELRTPVALIKGYANTLNRQDAQWTQDVIYRSMEVIEDEADRLSILIDDLLIASKIQVDREMKLTISDVDLPSLAHRSLERLSTQSTKHNFIFSFQENFPTISADEKMLRQAIDNLLTNAIKYSPKGGDITIGGRYTDDSVTLFVRDEGQGISHADQERIFERFYRVDDSLTSRTQGTGIGLYLVKAILEAHKGTIRVKSQVGHGSTFYFTIPRD